MKLNNEINPDLEVNQLLLDRNFLRLLKVYFKGQALNKSEFSDEINMFIEKINEINFNENKVYFSIEYIFENLGLIFSDSENLGKFMIFLDKYSINPDLKTVFSIVGDYLLSTYKNKSIFANELIYISAHLNEKVEKIFFGKKFENPIFQLKENGFPIISNELILLNSVYLEDSIDLYGNEKPDEIYVKVKDIAGKSFYQNRNGEILKTIDKKITDGENELFFRELVLQDENGEKTIIFDTDFNKMNLLNLIEFLNIGNESTIKLLSNVGNKSRYDEVFLSEIMDIYNFNGIKFAKFSTDSFNIEENTFIIRADGLILKDLEYVDGKENIKSEKNIKHLFDIVDIAGLEFVSFSYLDYSFLEKELVMDLFLIDGLIDINGQVMYIKGEPLIEIEEIQFKDYYKINDRDNFILSKKQLLEELKSYTAFNTQDNLIEIDESEYDEDLDKIGGNLDNGFFLGFLEEETFYYNGKLLEKILGNIGDEGDLEIYLKYDGKLNVIEYRELIDYFRKNDKSGEILACINYHIEKISY